MRTLLWFRGKDLRVRDHAALHQACATSREVVPVFVLAERYFDVSQPNPSPHRLQFLLDSLRELSVTLAELGSRLHVVRGPASETIPRMAQQLGVERVLAMASCEPAARRRDERIARALGMPFIRYDHETLCAPGSLRTAAGGAFQVYTPFARAAALALADVTVLPAPKRLPALPVRLATCLSELEVPVNHELQRGGERQAQQRLAAFVAGPAACYEIDRDRMDLPGTSRLSADLHFGTLSVRDVWRTVSAQAGAPQRYRAELLWREFAHHTLYDRPELLSVPFRSGFRDFPWRDDDAGYEAWQRGQTGYPIVDAAARQLLREGFVHNRARMIAASFLTKHLLVHYRRGEAHYLRYLTDGDLAQNNLGWQWCAGCGCDAQPYFRVFNPMKQGVRFDPTGDYVRRYVPELARLPTRYLDAPWLAPSGTLRDAGVTLGETYPRPIVDHATARQRYLLVASEHLRRN